MNISTSFFITGAIVLLASCGKKEQKEETKKQFCISDTMAKMITIDTVKQDYIEEELQLSGEVSFDENAVVKVFPNSSGQIRQVSVSLGDYVTKGQILAVIKSADIAGNYNDLTSADADLAIAKKQMDNEASLYKNGIASEKEFEESKQNYYKAVATKSKITSLISINGGGSTVAGGTYYIKAPISGFIVEKKVNAGSFIRQDMSDNMFTISDLKNVWIWANVFEADIAKVKEGFSAVVTTLAYPDKKFFGTVNKVSQVLDPINKAMKIKITLPNSDLLLKPEMFTKVTITNTENKQCIYIPREAVVEENSQKFVIIYNDACNLNVQEINVLKEVGGKCYISGGLLPGQKIVTKNALLLYDEFTDNN